MIEKKLLKKNRYDRLLQLLIILLVFGIIGGALQPVRIFTLLLVPKTISFYVKNKNMFSMFMFEFVFFVCWLLYGIISISWGTDLISGFKELSYLLLNFMLFFVFTFLAIKANKVYHSIIFAWLFLFLLTVPIAVYEIIVDVHLPTSLQQSNNIIGGDGRLRHFASVTYGNLNGYNQLLVYLCPFIFSLFYLYRKGFQTLLISILTLMYLSIILLNSSRAAVLSAVIVISVFYLSKKKINKWVYILPTLFFITLVTYYYDEIFFMITYRLDHQGFEDGIRTQIIQSGLMSLENSMFMGVGAGNFQANMEENYDLVINAPHNLFLEIGVQYGLLILMGFFFLLRKIYKNSRRNRIMVSRFVVYSGLLAFPIMAIINSGHLLSMLTWLYIYSLYVFSNPRFLYNKLV
ncbi:O-antigen ligase family protein [Wenyingzhuangia marina]|uniref:O-Antigen ligase n=1 Tax=Wenyingzhuangia marina TaxID=1195760 RepID=A0A1M5X168_9FLAO|nr:O-antigen ligase family protein [Wenyingzhuangia marina]GGF60968.1 hypothetical protein GCM10011397_00110 [Wenyingzhuangia marina]SHH93626.1 O-Antigen ligase [Wenyingzhuangia marina]